MPSDPIIEPSHRDIYPFIDPAHNLKDAAAGKTILITGGGAGLGAAIAKSFALASASAIILTGRRLQPLDATVAELRQLRPDCKVSRYQVDHTRDDDVVKLFDEELKKDGFGRVDVLVNNAGRAVHQKTTQESDLDAWWGDWELNVKGVFLTSRAYLRSLQPAGEEGKNEGGRIINLTTGGSNVYMPAMSSYSCSKTALNRLTEFLDKDGETQGVRCLSYHPGAVLSTEMGQTIPQWLREMLDKRGQETPELGAATAVYLSLPRSDFLGGRVVYATWDMEQLEGLKESIERDDLFKQRIQFG